MTIALSGALNAEELTRCQHLAQQLRGTTISLPAVEALNNAIAMRADVERTWMGKVKFEGGTVRPDLLSKLQLQGNAVSGIVDKLAASSAPLQKLQVDAAALAGLSKAIGESYVPPAVLRPTDEVYALPARVDDAIYEATLEQLENERDMKNVLVQLAELFERQLDADAERDRVTTRRFWCITFPLLVATLVVGVVAIVATIATAT